MRQIEITDIFGDKVVLEPELRLYTVQDFMGAQMSNLAIQLYSHDQEGFREPYSSLTVNFGEFLGVRDCAYIDTNNNYFAKQLLEMGFCQDTGFTKQSGWCTYPLWKFDRNFLKEIDVHGLYATYEKKFEEYMAEDAQASLEDREMEVVSDVMDSLGITFEMDADSNGMVVWTNDTVYYGSDIYKYLLGEVCQYDENGAVKGLALDLCNDFFDLCEMNKVYPGVYNRPAKADTEYVITLSSGHGTVLDFMTFGSFREAFETCESYGWAFKDENEFEWELEIDERPTSLEAQDNSLSFASDEDKMADFAILTKDEFLASYSYLTEEEYDATARVLSRMKENPSLEEKLTAAKEESSQQEKDNIGHDKEDCDYGR